MYAFIEACVCVCVCVLDLFCVDLVWNFVTMWMHAACMHSCLNLLMHMCVCARFVLCWFSLKLRNYVNVRICIHVCMYDTSSVIENVNLYLMYGFHPLVAWGVFTVMACTKVCICTTLKGCMHMHTHKYFSFPYAWYAAEHFDTLTQCTYKRIKHTMYKLRALNKIVNFLVRNLKEGPHLIWLETLYLHVPQNSLSWLTNWVRSESLS